MAFKEEKPAETVDNENLSWTVGYLHQRLALLPGPEIRQDDLSLFGSFKCPTVCCKGREKRSSIKN
ncbi:hypothetical protein OUZ56_007644 [Daphnia magna]|uniref:Uncharacterized protein n=1 Tax=Daphnia magna TaxID=35525 RepID=A0ABR0AAS3_9CRUS|nr:hypothetical protein OUZ56_007644 [Daphnia magna]